MDQRGFDDLVKQGCYDYPHKNKKLGAQLMLRQLSLQISLIKIIQSFLVTFATVLIVSCGGDGNSGPLPENNDRDGDGIINAEDAFPDDPSESVDSDGDGIGNNADTDDDGDGALDYEDPFPLDATVVESKRVPAEIGILK